MIAEPLVGVACVVCGAGTHDVICPPREVEAHVQYLHRFHRRRLRPDGSGRVPAEALSDRAAFTQDYPTSIVACRECGLVFRNPRPTAVAIADAYTRDEYGRDRLEALFEAQLELYRPCAGFLARTLESGTRPPFVVEAGSFVGGFLAAGMGRGWRVLGVDPGREVAAFCRQRDLPVFEGTLADAPVAPGSVDCVAIWNTLDQLPDPEPTLGAARRLLRPGGLLAVRVPNGDCFRWAVSWLRRLRGVTRGWLRAGLAWNNLLAFPYLNGYSIRSLEWLLSWHNLQRIAVHPNTLARLSDDRTRTWAACEERLLKTLCRAAARLERAQGGDEARLAPWLDVYFRAGGVGR